MYFILASQPLLSFFGYVLGSYCEKILEKGTLEERERAGLEEQRGGGERRGGTRGQGLLIALNLLSGHQTPSPRSHANGSASPYISTRSRVNKQIFTEHF